MPQVRIVIVRHCLRVDIKQMQSEKVMVNARMIDQEARGRRDNLFFHSIQEQENISKTISASFEDELQDDIQYSGKVEVLMMYILLSMCTRNWYIISDKKTDMKKAKKHYIHTDAARLLLDHGPDIDARSVYGKMELCDGHIGKEEEGGCLMK